MKDNKTININSMSDREIVAALLARDRGITEAYFYRKCYPLFKACFDSYYTDCETCIEFINEIYLYFMFPIRKIFIRHFSSFPLQN